MGCSRAHDGEALSDYLLALRALLDGTDEAGRAALTPRLAALCAEEPHRKALQRRLELAFALEDFAMAGGDAARVPRAPERRHAARRSCSRSRRTCARCCATSSAASSTAT